MTITHGTRSAYNRGCRCDACREASRMARARQRAAVAQRPAGIGPRGVPAYGDTSDPPRSLFSCGLFALASKLGSAGQRNFDPMLGRRSSLASM